MSLSAVSRCPDVRGTCSSYGDRTFAAAAWTSVVELTTSPAVQSMHQLRTVQTTAEGVISSGTMNTRSVTFDMQRHRKTFYLLTCLRTDGRTDTHDDIGRACIASRGKNRNHSAM